jgi:hypothetical protein
LLVLEENVRDRVRSEVARVVELVTPPESLDQAAYEDIESRRERRDNWCRRVEDAVLDLGHALPAGCEDFEARQLFVFLTELRHAISDDPTVADLEGRVALATAQMADVIRRMKRRFEHTQLEDEQEAVRFVFDNLPHTDASTLAQLLGVSTKTVGTWRNGGVVKQKKTRVKLVAQLLAYLRNSMTETGLIMWFNHDADLLRGSSPLKLLEAMDSGDTGVWDQLRTYARGGRAQLAN